MGLTTSARLETPLRLCAMQQMGSTTDARLGQSRKGWPVCHRALPHPDLTSGWVYCAEAGQGLLKASRSMHSLRKRGLGNLPWLMGQACG